MQRELVLCVGMHRSGTSLTASMLQAIGLPLPGQLIGADVANPSGYFENRSIVDAQENLLRELGYWWPTESASQGMPKRLRRSVVYRDYQEWLVAYLGEIFANQGPRLAIKDPRTSLLLPAWRTVATRLGIKLRLVICLRQPRDVCWSLVWRDGPSVGVGWQRAQRLWLEHYRALLIDGQGLPAEVAIYEHWLDSAMADAQLTKLAHFLELSPSQEQRDDALGRVKPEFNHGGGERLPAVASSLRLMHATLSRAESRNERWCSAVAQYRSVALKTEQLLSKARSRLQLLALLTPQGRKRVSHALDANLLRKQLGRNSLTRYWRRFSSEEDLRPHPLISPMYLNQERRRCGLPPLRTAGDLFLHLLNPDLIPMNPHPWFNCRLYQKRAQLLGCAGEHPILTYLRCNQEGLPNPYIAPCLLKQLGAGRRLNALSPLPPFIQSLYPGLVLADAIQSLGDPASGDPAVVVAHEAHWQELRETFEAWPSSDPQGPLNWLTAQGGLGQVARDQAQAAEGTACWWLPGDWPALVLADLAGTDPELNRRFETAEAMINALKTWQEGEPRPLIALTPTLLAAVLSEQAPLPRGAVVLNLCWPEPDLQSAWLHLLARATAVLECRPAVRAYLKSLGLSVSWPSPSVRQTLPQTASGLRYLLLSLTESAAEATLARHAEKLDPYRYSAFLRLDAQMLSLESEAKSPIAWLEAVREKHDRWVWLTGTPTPEDIRTWSIQAWAEQRGVAMQMLEQNDATWVTALCKPETDA